MTPINILTTALQQLAPFEDPLHPALAALAASDLTLGSLLTLALLVDDCNDGADGEMRHVHRITKACYALPPTPLPLLPVGT